MIVNVVIEEGEEEYAEEVVLVVEMEVVEVGDLVVIPIEIVILETIILKTGNLGNGFENQDGI